MKIFATPSINQRFVEDKGGFRLLPESPSHHKMIIERANLFPANGWIVAKIVQNSATQFQAPEIFFIDVGENLQPDLLGKHAGILHLLYRHVLCRHLLCRHVHCRHVMGRHVICHLQN
jgi:hypothetical protein